MHEYNPVYVVGNVKEGKPENESAFLGGQFDRILLDSVAQRIDELVKLDNALRSQQ